ncbi:MAG TPA: hypothetical protein VIH06_06410 [Ilumatobacteraceae bacterium]
MLTQGSVPSIDGGLAAVPRRSFLHLGGAGLALGGLVAVGANLGSRAEASQAGPRRRTLDVAQQMFTTIQTGSTTAIWAMIADGGSVEFPFLHAKFIDFEAFDAGIGPLLAVLGGLTYAGFVFEGLEDPNALIAKYTGHAVVTFNGKSYDQTYSTEIHVRDDKVMSYAEYFDTAVLNAALAP